MSDSDTNDEVAKASQGRLDQFSPSITRTVVERVGPILRRYFRAELHGLDAFPSRVAHWWCPTTPVGC
jgi:hypothetical protein